MNSLSSGLMERPTQTMPRWSIDVRVPRTKARAICSGLQAFAHRRSFRGPCRRLFQDTTGPGTGYPARSHDDASQPFLDLGSQRRVARKLRLLWAASSALGVPLRCRRTILEAAASGGGAGGRNTMVQEGRGHAAIDVWAIGEAALWSVSLFCGAGGDRAPSRSGLLHAGGRSPARAGGIDNLPRAAAQRIRTPCFFRK